MHSKFRIVAVLAAAGLIKGVLLVAPLNHVAGIAFGAGPESLTPGAAWMGMLAGWLSFYLSVSALADGVKAVAVLVGKEVTAFRFSYLRPSLTAMGQTLVDSVRHGTWLYGVAAGIAVMPSAGGWPTLAAAGLLGLALVVERSCERWLAWLPGITRIAGTMLTWMFLLALCRTGTFGHAAIYVKALVGQSELTESALITSARVTLDGYLLATAATFVLALIIPPLHGMLQPAHRWLAAAALPALAVFLLWAGSDRVAGRFRAFCLGSKLAECGEVFPARDGTLIDVHELEAVSGWGSVAPRLSSPRRPVSTVPHTIREITSYLKDRSVSLLLIPVPMKAAIYPELVTGSPPDQSEAPLYHAAQPGLYAELGAGGADVQDITDAMLQLKDRRTRVFMAQSSLWTPDAMQVLAKAIAGHVRKRYPGLVPNDPLIVDAKARDGVFAGDLAVRAGIDLPPERVVLLSFASIEGDPRSPILVVGDQELRVFDDPALGYIPKDAAPGQALRAGFSQHLSLYLGREVESQPVLGGGAEGVRKALESRPAESWERKRLVIWLVPARELVAQP